MDRAKLIRDNGLSRIYRTSQNVLVKMELNEDFTEITFSLVKDSQPFGEFNFQELRYGVYKLTRMYSEPYQREGLGRAALEIFKRFVTGDIVVSPNDGQVRSDGSHLTGDALYFVSKMMDEGLIKGYEDCSDNDDNGFIDL